MSNPTIAGRYRRSALLAAPFFAAFMLLHGPQAQALSCDVIADQLSHQNTPLQDAAKRLASCAKKYAKYEETLLSKTKSQWESLCDNDKDYYAKLLNNRQQILVNCRPRGSDG